MPRHETAHAALLTTVLDVMRGSSAAPSDESSLSETEQLSPGELRVLRYLPTNLSRPEIASELSVSVNTVNTHIRQSTRNSRRKIVPRQFSAHGNDGCSQLA